MDGKEAALGTRDKPRLIAMSRSGRFVAIRQSHGVDLVDALGTNPRRSAADGAVIDFGFVGDELWVINASGLMRFGSDGSPRADAPVRGEFGRGRLVPGPGDRATMAIWHGEATAALRVVGDEVVVEALPLEVAAASLVVPLRGGRIALASDSGVELRGEGGSRRLPGKLRPTQVAELFGGRVLAMVHAGSGGRELVVMKASGARLHAIELEPGFAAVAFAETRGLAVASSGQQLIAYDLRYGRRLGQGELPLDLDAVAIDTAGRFIASAGFREGDGELAVLHLPYTSVFAGGRSASHESEDEGEQRERPDGDDPGPRHRSELQRPAPVVSIDAAGSDDGDEDDGREDGGPRDPQPEDDEGPVKIPAAPPIALGRLPELPRPQGPGGGTPYQGPEEHVEDLIDLIAARTAKAIADAWNSGRLSLPNLDRLPFEHEVRALVGERAGHAEEAVERAERRVIEIAGRVTARAQASLHAGRSLPFFEVVNEFGLSRVAAQALMVAAAPQLRGELARLYGVLANDEGRPICDRYLIEVILGGDDGAARQAVARELETDAPLIHYGLLRVLPAPPDMYLFAPITVDPVMIARLRGHPFAGYEVGTVSEIQRADRPLDQLAIDRRVVRDIVTDLSELPAGGRPVRVVVRGRSGSGRTALLAALAEQIDRVIAMIHCERLPRDGRALAQRLRVELRRARLRGAIPCVSGIEVSGQDEPEGIEHLREVFRTHPGPVLMRTTPEYSPPLEPGYFDYTIPPQSEGERQRAWSEAAVTADLPLSDPAALAGRFRIGPGTIQRVVQSVRGRLASGVLEASDDYLAELDRTARQHIDTRLSSVASRVTRRARWEQVALPDDLLDSIREFIGRIRHRRTVYESWGFDRKMSTSRGLTALFYGAPGTGKSMVSGLIARELDLDLYRVDLARITSKWVGETEKNLAEIFDAAEDGQAVVVFDEADSLFAKRTEVKSSVDRYANLEVNYLLQRLDSFEGIAILTTNLEGSIDNAFKRRMSLRLAFPFPDEDMRVRLWAAHIPTELPTAGDFDFQDLAKRFPMSGGYIRNCTLRAAFLAAQEDQPLSQSHLERAIQLEYREMGKLAPGGRME